MSFFTVNSNQDINDMLAYDLYRSFQSAVETIKQNGGTFGDLEKICDSFMPVDQAHPNTIDTPIPQMKDCRGDIIAICKFGMIGAALIGHSDGEPNIQDFKIADAYHAFYRDGLTKQYYFHEMKEKYAARDGFLENPVKESDPLMKFIEQEVPFRLTEIHGIENPDEDMVHDIIDALKEDTDVLFNYDSIDDFILNLVDEHTQGNHASLDFETVLNKNWIYDKQYDEYVAEENYVLDSIKACELFYELYKDDYDCFDEFLETYEPEKEGAALYAVAKERGLVKEEYIALSAEGIELGLKQVNVNGKNYPVILNDIGEYVVDIKSSSKENNKQSSFADKINVAENTAKELLGQNAKISQKKEVER